MFITFTSPPHWGQASCDWLSEKSAFQLHWVDLADSICLHVRLNLNAAQLQVQSCAYRPKVDSPKLTVYTDPLVPRTFVTKFKAVSQTALVSMVRSGMLSHLLVGINIVLHHNHTIIEWKSPSPIRPMVCRVQYDDIIQSNHEMIAGFYGAIPWHDFCSEHD